jgi:Peptidase family M28
MRIFTAKAPDTTRRGRAAAPPVAPGTMSARFGREQLYFAEEPTAPRAATRGARPPSREESVSREQLHVVVQNGRQFQEHNPNVPVLHDRGRFLLVQLDPEEAKKLQRKDKTCYGVLPLADGDVVFDERARTAGRAPVSFVQGLVDLATEEGIEASVKELVAFPTRHSTSASFTKASTLVRRKLNDLGYKTRLQTITVNGKKSRNVIADKAGLGPKSRGVVLATAHLDSVNLADGASAPAPGADDNGSGSAGVLEIALAFAQHRGVHDLRLILFGGEEQGLFGSKQYVASLKPKERSRIRAVVNMDMISNLNSEAKTVLLEGSPLSQSIIDGLAAAASTYTGLTVETSLNPFASDHVPFLDAKIPAVLTIEGADSANSDIHSANDTMDKLEFGLALEIVRMNIGFLAAEVGHTP